MGIPYRLTVGPKGLAQKQVELVRRRDGRTQVLDLQRAAEIAAEAVLEDRA